jgi:aconitate hydratase
MINGLGVLGWGVGGIEAEAAMLGQPVSMLLPEVIGFRLTGKLKEGVTATDLVLTVTQMLRKKGVVGKFVEFFGEGLANMTLADRATIGNMAPEYGATCGFFPVDGETIRYLETDRPRPEIASRWSRPIARRRACGARTAMEDPVFTDTLELDLGDVVPSMAGPKRPRAAWRWATSRRFRGAMDQANTRRRGDLPRSATPVKGTDFDLGHGDVAIAAITSCTNTSNPSVLIGAGLLARNANRLGLKQKPWVKTSLAPGSAGGGRISREGRPAEGTRPDRLQPGRLRLHHLHRQFRPAAGPDLQDDQRQGPDRRLVLSGNRNFEGRVSPDVQANYLASPPLVVAYALAGTVKIDLTTEPLGEDKDGNPVYLKDIWPTSRRSTSSSRSTSPASCSPRAMPTSSRATRTGRRCRRRPARPMPGTTGSTYVQNPPYFEGMDKTPRPAGDIKGARILGLFGDKITTDHISPAGSIKAASPAGKYLMDNGVEVVDFNQYGTRRGNHEVMMRGTFANIRIRNHMLGENGARAATRSTIRPRTRCRSTTRPCATRRRACRWSSSPASNTATAPRATGRPRAPTCSACAP